MNKLKTLIFSGILLAFVGPAHAEKKQYLNKVLNPPDAEAFTSQAVYVASATCADNSSLGNSVDLSSGPAGYFFAVNVTSAGGAGSTLNIFDAHSTTNSARKISETIDVSAKQPWEYNVGFSSGLTYNLHWLNGTGCVSFIYYEK